MYTIKIYLIMNLMICLFGALKWFDLNNIMLAKILSFIGRRGSICFVKEKILKY